MVVLAQLAPKHGFQIKWALEFPGAPLGAIEYILAHVIKKLGDAGVKSATFGAGATGKFQVVENIHGFRVKTLEKAYNGLSSTFKLTNKGDFRSKFGTWQDPVSWRVAVPDHRGRARDEIGCDVDVLFVCYGSCTSVILRAALA